MYGRVQLLQEGLVEVVGSNQENHVAEVVVAPRRQFELDQLRQGEYADLLDPLAGLGRIGERERPRLPRARVSASDEAIHRHAALPLQEAARPPFDLFIFLAGEFLSKAL